MVRIQCFHVKERYCDDPIYELRKCDGKDFEFIFDDHRICFEEQIENAFREYIDDKFEVVSVKGAVE